MEPVYLVLPTTAFGGAEKRFLGLFVGLLAECPWLRLVASRSLIELAGQTDEFRAIREPLGERLVTFGEGRAALAAALVGRFLRHPRAVFHYVLIPPPLVQVFPSRRIVFTIPLSGVNLYSRVGRWSLYAGAIAAARTDFLDYGVEQHFRRRLPRLASRFSVTPGSFIDTTHYQSAPARGKQDLVVFMGLFSEEKQAFRLAAQLPQVLDALAHVGHRSVAFRFHGREAGGERTLADVLARLPPQLDVASSFESEPRRALARAKVFLSLQRNTNYPSKSLLEALACGALPVITDVADSRRMVPEGVAEWIPRDFEVSDLASAIGRLLALTPDEHDRRVALARAHLHQHFSFRAMAAYYRGLWATVARSEP